MRERSESRVLCFSSFELDLQTGTLRDNGERIPLQEMPFQVLAALLEKPGELVTREELCQRLWGSDTFVEFEDNLNHAVSRLREALGDSASNPRFIETLPRRGYCFIAPIEEISTRRVKRVWLPVIFAASVLVVAGLGWWQFIRPDTLAGEGQQNPSLAVLPFENSSGDPEDEYFSDGLTDAIIAHVSMLEDLKVISRTSSVLYRNSAKSVFEIGEELGVTAVLEGTVLRQGDRVRITAQLIDAKSEGHLWTEIYERDLTDLFAIQSDVAQQIASALHVEMSPEKKERIERSPTDDFTAYDYYLRGMHYFRKFMDPPREEQEIENAISLFRRALEVDSQFALAYTGLARAYIRQENWLDFPPSHMEKALEMAQMALSIDPNLPEGHASLGAVYSRMNWIQKALQAYEKATKLDPNGIIGLNGLAWNYPDVGQFDNALIASRRGLTRDPANPEQWFSLISQSYLHLGELDQAEMWANKALELAPDNWIALTNLAYVALGRGQLDEAERIVQDLAVAFPSARAFVLGVAAEWRGDYDTAEENFQKQRGPYGSVHLARILYKKGKPKEAALLLDQVTQFVHDQLEQGADSAANREILARIHALKGNKEEAYRWLQEEFNIGVLDHSVAYNPAWDNLRGEPRFQKIIAKVNAEKEVMLRRVQEMEKEWE